MHIQSQIQEKMKQRGLWQDALHRFSKNKLAIFGLISSIILILVTIFAPLVAPYPFEKQDYSAVGEGPSIKHLMGTDMLGRDLFSRVFSAGVSRSV